MFIYYIYRLVITFFVFIWISWYYVYLSVISVVVNVRKEEKLAAGVRASFEFLGATYIKLGQIMSMRPDYFSPELCNELFKLFDKAKPVKYDTILHTLKKRLGVSYDLIRAIEPLPIGSASFAQVHKATLTDGSPVAVKIRRPGIEKKVKADLLYLRIIVWLIDASTIFSYIKLKSFYTEFAAWTREELNYLIEAGNSLRVHKNLAADSDKFSVPQIIWELSTDTVLTMEIFEGVWLSDIFKGKAEIPEMFDARETSSEIVQVFLKQIFIDGFFQADPHPGNIILLPTGRIGLIDFGIVGIMDSSFKRNMLELLSKIGERDTEGAFNAILKIIKPPRDVDIGMLKKEYEDNLNKWYNGLDIPILDFHEKTAAKLLLSNIQSLQRNKITLPHVVVQFYRCVILLESVALSLNPSGSIFAEMNRFFEEYKKAQLAEKTSVAGIIETLRKYTRLFLFLPEKIEVLLEKITQTDLDFKPYVNNVFKAAVTFLNLVSYLAFAACIVLAVMKIFGIRAGGPVLETHAVEYIFYTLGIGLLARFFRRFISIEFR